MEAFIDSLYVNLSTIVVVTVSFLVLRKSVIKSRSLFLSGLFIILLSGLIAVPVSEMVLAYFEPTKFNLYIVSNLVGILHGAGVFCCVLAYRGQQGNV